MWVDFDVRGQQEMEFFTGRSIIMDYGQVFWPEAMILNYNLNNSSQGRWNMEFRQGQYKGKHNKKLPMKLNIDWSMCSKWLK